MKRLIYLILAVLLIVLPVSGCDQAKPGGNTPEKVKPKLNQFVGVWKSSEQDLYYRLTPSGTWFSYNENGEVVFKGDVSFDGETFDLVTEDNHNILLYVGENDTLLDEKGIRYSRSDFSSSLMSSQQYEAYFNTWFEEKNLNGNTLMISEPDIWIYRDAKGNVIQKGNFYAYAGEEEVLYFYLSEDNSFYARARLVESDLIFEIHNTDSVKQIRFATELNSTQREIYFMDKGIDCNYILDSGTRLLRNGGAAFNDSHDYKKMPVTCSIDLVEDQIDEMGNRKAKINITYDFYRRDLPILSGNRIFNSVRFSQYDYYTGELFYLGNSEGDAAQNIQWTTSHDGVDYLIDCQFSSTWEYFQDEEVAVRFCGSYSLTIPADYDGFVVCLRPVYNSYSSQVSASISPEEGTLLMEDLGEDFDKSIFCRLEKPSGNILTPFNNL